MLSAATVLIGLSEPARAQTAYEDLAAAAERPMEELERTARAAPADPIALVPLGIARLNADRWDDAIAIFARVLEIDSNFGFAHVFLGVAFNMKASAFPIRTMEGDQPGRPEALDLPEEQRRALISRSDAAFGRATELQPDDATAWLFWGQHLMRRSQNNVLLLPADAPEPIIGKLRRALAIEPEHIGALGELAYVLRTYGTFAWVIAFRDYPPLPWTPNNPAALAESYLVEAADIYWRFIAMHPDQMRLDGEIISMFLVLDQPERALRYCVDFARMGVSQRDARDVQEAWRASLDFVRSRDGESAQYGALERDFRTCATALSAGE